MFFRVLVLLTLLISGVLTPSVAWARTFKQALPGYVFSFPRDHVSHDEFKTEWWYYTGHLESKDQKHYGYELTFFRTGVDELPVKQRSPWDVKDIFLAHFAITDENNKTFHYFEKLNRSGLSSAGARLDHYYVFNENWSIEQLGNQFVLKADTSDFGLHLLLTSGKPPVVHGKDGVSQKASCKGCASHYYSMTRLKSDGYVYLKGQSVPVSGTSWMDHEFGSNQLTSEQVGWDWYSVQLNDNTELMLYVIKKTDGSIDSNSSGTIVYADGSSKHITQSEFSITTKRQWKSPHTGGMYPMDWTINVPSQKISLNLVPVLDDQELSTAKSTGVSYWEGATTVNGQVNGKSVKGQAYVEMTGYAEKFHKKI
ncbi:MAG: carotenoid 1,2-hydratase [Candidatus Melainabacteria bacterium]|nr:MAG: carotenoid 1,2-hydratase [Candidatus Melainabacteria bacterium]